jgi:hypothetical protein
MSEASVALLVLQRPDCIDPNGSFDHTSTDIGPAVLDFDDSIKLVVSKCTGIDCCDVFRWSGIDLHEVHFTARSDKPGVA